MSSSLISFTEILVFLCVLATSLAIPLWEGLPGASSIGSIVPGAVSIEAVSAYRTGSAKHHLSIRSINHPGELIIGPLYKQTPPLFYIYQNKLFHFQNESTIYHVNIVNATETLKGTIESTGAFRLVLSDKSGGVGGYWKWIGTRLHYDYPGMRTSNGLFYSCKQNGTAGVFMFPQVSTTPTGCSTLTLHTFEKNYDTP